MTEVRKVKLRCNQCGTEKAPLDDDMLTKAVDALVAVAHRHKVGEGYAEVLDRIGDVLRVVSDWDHELLVSRAETILQPVIDE